MPKVKVVCNEQFPVYDIFMDETLENGYDHEIELSVAEFKLMKSVLKMHKKVQDTIDDKINGR